MTYRIWRHIWVDHFPLFLSLVMGHRSLQRILFLVASNWLHAIHGDILTMAPESWIWIFGSAGIFENNQSHNRGHTRSYTPTKLTWHWNIPILLIGNTSSFMVDFLLSCVFFFGGVQYLEFPPDPPLEGDWFLHKNKQFINKHQAGKSHLVGGFNPFETYQSNWIISPSWGEHEKIFETITQTSIDKKIELCNKLFSRHSKNPRNQGRSSLKAIQLLVTRWGVLK